MRPEQIKALRLKLMLTQVEFAKLLGVAFQSVNRYENGKSVPTMKVKRKLNQLLKEVDMVEE